LSSSGGKANLWLETRTLGLGKKPISRPSKMFGSGKGEKNLTPEKREELLIDPHKLPCVRPLEGWPMGKIGLD